MFCNLMTEFTLCGNYILLHANALTMILWDQIIENHNLVSMFLLHQ